METKRGRNPFLAEDMATYFANRWFTTAAHASLLIHSYFATAVTEELEDLQASWVGQRLEFDYDGVCTHNIVILLQF